MTDILATIAQARDERVADLYVDLPIPSWDGALVGRFNVLPRKDVEMFTKRKAGTEADMDFIIRATREIYVLDDSGNVSGQRMEEDNRYVRIEDEHGVPVMWTSVLAEKLGHPEFDRAQVVLDYCFRGNSIAISATAVKLVRWMQNTDSEVAEAISGE